MCGIAGLVSLRFDQPVDAGRLARMRDAIAHRGPDDAGLWVDGAVGLAHRRLSIVDVAGGHQPMANEDESVWIVFNGEIYNHMDLRPGLEARGHRFRTRSDTEAILHLYEEVGDRAVEELRGMFAFAIWDSRARRLLLGRDRLGIKPLYYVSTDRELAFASEIKALVAGGAVRPALDEAVLPELLATRFIAGEETLFRGVRKLLPGHTLSWSPGEGFSGRRYWTLPPPAVRAPRGLRAEAAELSVRLRAAVRRHLMSDVPLGVFLSGGLDSSALAALVTDLTGEPVPTFSVGFADADANELPWAQLVAGHLGSEHREVLLSPRQYFEALPSLIWHEDEPMAFPSSVPLYFVSRLARDHVKVVLTGEGADELFLGYNRYRVTWWNGRVGAPYWAATSRPVRDGVRRAVGRMPAGIRRYASRSFLALEPGPRTLFFENFAVFSDDLLRRLMARPQLLRARDPWGAALRAYGEAGGDALDRMGRADLQTYLHELLMKQDQMSMAASIESRVPYLDDELVQHVAALPGRLKVRGWRTKAVLREAVRRLLPPDVLTRRKKGFPVPIGRWLAGDYWPVAEEFTLGARAQARRLFDPAAVRALAEAHRRGEAGHGDRLWLLVNLEIWQRIFLDGEAPADVMRAVTRRAGVFHASAVGQAGRPVAAEHGRPAAQPAAPVGALDAPPGRPRHHVWPRAR